MVLEPPRQDLSFLYVTFPDKATAKSVCATAVTARLAACANILGEGASVYRWNGAIESETEVYAILKARSADIEALMELVAREHPYDVPALIEIPLGRVVEAYAAWLATETDR